MRYTECIKEGIQYLPSKDINIAKSYYNNRDFHSLYELVDSAIVKVEKYRKNNPEGTKYNDIDLDNLGELKSTLIDYIAMIDDIDEELSHEKWEEYDQIEEYDEEFE